MSARRFGYSMVSSTLHDALAVASLTAPVRALLDDLGGTADDGSTSRRGRRIRLRSTSIATS